MNTGLQVKIPDASLGQTPRLNKARHFPGSGNESTREGGPFTDVIEVFFLAAAFGFVFVVAFALRVGAWRTGRGTSNDRRECERAPRDARGGNNKRGVSRTFFL